MVQRSVTQQTTLTGERKPLLAFRWMRHFFTEETSSDQRHIADLQRRAAWIAVALILQTLSGLPLATPLGALLPFGLILAGFGALYMAFRSHSKKEKDTATSTQTTSHSSMRPKLWQRVMLILTCVFTLVGVYECGVAVFQCFQSPRFSNDGTSIDTNAAILLVKGRNPYTDSNFPDLLRQFSIQPEWTTPLREGQFVNRLDYPSMAELQSIMTTSLKAGNVPEFEARVSYPALSFLTLVPFALVQNYNVLPFYLICYVLIVFIAWKSVRRELRPWVALLAIANVPMLASTVGGNLDILYTLFLLISWLKRDMRWTSAIFLGLALATKQISWYFVPFYAIMTLQYYGWRNSLQRLLISGAVALAINLPFIMWNYHTWLAGIMAPVADPMFPLGIGLVSLSTSHILPYFPTWVYSVLELGGMLLTYVWYWRICRKHPEAVFLLATMPLFLAWRSLSSYFYCVAFPLFMLLTAHMKPATQPRFAFLRALHKTSEPRRLTASI